MKEQIQSWRNCFSHEGTGLAIKKLFSHEENDSLKTELIQLWRNWFRHEETDSAMKKLIQLWRNLFTPEETWFSHEGNVILSWRNWFIHEKTGSAREKLISAIKVVVYPKLRESIFLL